MKLSAALIAAALLPAGIGSAQAITFTLLPGVTGGSPAATGVFEADLSALVGTIGSVTIKDNSSTSAGSPGQFSGFDLDAIVLSTQSISNASQANGLTPAAQFNVLNTVFIPGTQTPPPGPALFGTAAGKVNPAVATLGSFDGNSTTAIPGAFGFVSLGVGGSLSLNLTAPFQATGGPLFLYIGEVGNNGEVAASSITISSNPVPAVPLPPALPMFGAALLTLVGLGFLRQKAGAAAPGTA